MLIVYLDEGDRDHIHCECEMYTFYDCEPVFHGCFEGTWPYEFRFHADYVTANFYLWHLNMRRINTKCVLGEDGIFEFADKEYFDYLNTTDLTDKYIDIYSNTVRTDVTVYTDRNKSEIAFTLKEGDRVLELGGDAHCWVKILKADTHEEGWLYSKAYEQLKCPDGNYLYANESPVFLEDEESGLSMFSDLHYGG